MIPILDGYISLPDLAAALSVSERTVSRYEKGTDEDPDGLLSTMVGGRKLYRIDGVRKWLKRRERSPTRRRTRGGVT